jgi:hypothetical protein
MTTDDSQTEAPPPAGSGEAQQDVAQASDAKAEATGTAATGDELSEGDLEAVAAGRGDMANFTYNPAKQSGARFLDLLKPEVNPPDFHDPF